MKKKKVYEPTIWFWITIIIIILSVWFLGYSGIIPIQFEFNPDTDVCLEWECKDSGGWTRTGNAQCFPEDWNVIKCKKWQPKDKCQLNPEAEGCVCDEYDENYKHRGYIKLLFKTNTPNFYATLDENKSEIIIYVEGIKKEDVKFIDLIHGWQRGKCIKSHLANECEQLDENFIWDEGFYCNNKLITREKPKENETVEYKVECEVIHQDDMCIVFEWKKICREKNECEKNNPNFVWDNSSEWDTHYICNCINATIEKKNISTCEREVCTLCIGDCVSGCEWIGCKYYNATEEFCDLCYNYKKICRKKNIKDYSCKELKKALLTDKVILISVDNWLYADDSYNQIEIYDISIEKNCEI